MKYTREQIELEEKNLREMTEMLGVKSTVAAMLRQLLAENDALLNSHLQLLDMVDQHADFRNGVTDPTGCIDEGAIVAADNLRKFYEFLDEFRKPV